MAAILMLLLPATASGYDFKVDGIYYNVKDGQAEVTGAGNYSYNGVVVIPDKVTHDGITYPVVAIGYQTFIHCSVNKVSIPNSVRTIAAQAFYD